MVSRELSRITIVGMRFYSGSFDALINGANAKPNERFLFLVPEVNNDYDVNAVMLSNGKKKIASVSAEDAPKLKRLFEKWRQERGYDEVICVSLSHGHVYLADREHFQRRGSFTVYGTHRVHERLARKYAAKFNI